MGNVQQTYESFRNKWTHNRDLAFLETLREGSEIQNWILSRNGFPNAAAFQQWLSGRTRVLDAGCGNGRVTALLRCNTPVETALVGIDLTAADVARENLEALPNVSVMQKDLLGDLSDLGLFDLIYCQEVLHHTADPRGAFLNLCKQLAPRGEIAIYVYKLKAPMREFADDFIRDAISSLPYQAAIKEMQEITLLGKSLSELGAKITVPDVKVLGIEAGEYDVQRLVYHFFLKCFWNPGLTMEENVAINYDWYHPQLCTRHTLDEVLGWFAAADLSVIHHCVDPYGITARGVRQS